MKLQSLKLRKVLKAPLRLRQIVLRVIRRREKMLLLKKLKMRMILPLPDCLRVAGTCQDGVHRAAGGGREGQSHRGAEGQRGEVVVQDFPHLWGGQLRE